MQFAMTEEQQMIVDTTRAFVEKEIYPHELEVERSGHLPMKKSLAGPITRCTGPVWRGRRISSWRGPKSSARNISTPVFAVRNGIVSR